MFTCSVYATTKQTTRHRLSDKFPRNQRSNHLRHQGKLDRHYSKPKTFDFFIKKSPKMSELMPPQKMSNRRKCGAIRHRAKTSHKKVLLPCHDVTGQKPPIKRYYCPVMTFFREMVRINKYHVTWFQPMKWHKYLYA